MSSHGPWNFCPTATDLRPIGSRCCGPIGAELACGQPGGARGHASRARKLLGPGPPPQLVPELNTPARTRGAERSILQASDPAATYEARAEVAERYMTRQRTGSGARAMAGSRGASGLAGTRHHRWQQQQTGRTAALGDTASSSSPGRPSGPGRAHRPRRVSFVTYPSSVERARARTWRGRTYMHVCWRCRRLALCY